MYSAEDCAKLEKAFEGGWLKVNLNLEQFSVD
jgi:hypothetical protein